MKSQQLVGFPTAAANAYIGPDRELTVDTDRDELRLHNGVTAGGVRILNESQMQAYSSLQFTGVLTLGLTATRVLDGTETRKLVRVSAVGGVRDLVLPLLADLDIGENILIQATSDNVQLKPAAGQGWVKGIVDALNFSYTIPNGQILNLAKMTPTYYIVLNIQ